VEEATKKVVVPDVVIQTFQCKKEEKEIIYTGLTVTLHSRQTFPAASSTWLQLQKVMGGCWLQPLTLLPCFLHTLLLAERDKSVSS